MNGSAAPTRAHRASGSDPRPGEPHDPAGPGTLVETFARAVARYGSGIAVVTEEESLSYRRLDSWSRALGATLRAHGIGHGDRVALRMSPGAEAIAAMLAILRVGACYVPLDVRNPPSRNAFIVEDSRAVALVGTSDGCAEERDLLVVDEARVTELRQGPAPSDTEEAPPSPEDTAYVVYTSGTTGTPKGVPIHHGAVTALLSGAAEKFAFSVGERWLLFHSIAFDVSVWEIWGAFHTSGTLVIIPYRTTRSPEECLRAVRERGISVLTQTPTAFGTFSTAALRSEADLPELRYVVFAGEKLVPSALLPWARRFGLDRPALVNMYGITETTVHSTFHELGWEDVNDTTSVIGRVLPGFDHRVITPEGREAATGEQGVLWLAGPQVSHGYLNRPELNAERFRVMRSPRDGGEYRYYRSGDVVSPREDGGLVYHGREDLQVKLRGHRIELTDIEAAVRSHESVTDAVVWVREYGPEDSRLVCAYTAEGAVSTRTLREHVKKCLPSYMWPASYRRMSEFPRTLNGKLDRDTVIHRWETEKESENE
ncbi:amino acid adenylation domain-containing protein [Actinopolyspora mortivallis]|uniref:amino acid adenylation domain-containing protein n=1 Tax=Actinopolyspora mortivallis TaxID=33906 RepID=UPI0003789EA9|nr:amino acid adenylation domain-containing protein [Actinopolyspora mortivallis]